MAVAVVVAVEYVVAAVMVASDIAIAVVVAAEYDVSSLKLRPSLDRRKNKQQL